MNTDPVSREAATLVKMADMALGAMARKQPYFARLLEQDPAHAELIAWYKGFADEFVVRVEEFKRNLLESRGGAGLAAAGMGWGSSGIRGTCECRYDQVNGLTRTQPVVDTDGTAKVKVVFRGFPYHCGRRDLTVLAKDEEEVESLKATYSKDILRLYTFMANIDVAIMTKLEIVSLAETDADERRYATVAALDNEFCLFGLMRAVAHPNTPTSQSSATSSQSPEEIVQRHIRLLKEYNDMKDIGQQMIGLIAENQGVRIGSLYESGEYGVTGDD